MSRVVNLDEARRLKCHLCIYAEKTRKRKRYECGAYRDVTAYKCKYSKCPYDESTLKA